MANILVLLAQKKTLLIVMFSTFIAVISFLIFVDRKLAKKRLEPKKEELPTAESEIERMLRMKNQEYSLQDINNIARLFFSQKYGINKDLEYEEMFTFFKQAQKERAADFAKRMLEYSYSGEKIDGYKIAILLSSLKKMYEEEKEKEMPKESPVSSFFKKISQMIRFRKEEMPKELEETKYESPILESIRNLKPVTIKPESFKVSSPKKIYEEHSSDLDNMERIRNKIEERKSHLI